MFELEQAMLTQAGKKPAGTSQRQDGQADAGAGTPARAQAQAAQQSVAVERQTPASAGEGVQPVSVASRDDAVGEGGEAAARVAASVATLADDPAPAVKAVADGAAPFAATWCASAWKASAGIAPDGIAGVYALIGAALRPVQESQGGAAAVAEAGLPPLAARSMGAPAAPGMAGRSQDSARQQPFDIAAEQDAAPAGQSDAAVAGEEYAQRLLHVYRDAAGVQAWIRDAGIGQAQAQRLAQAMAGELGGAGVPLSALTLNGKRLPLAPAGVGVRDAYDGGDNAADTGRPTAVRHINQHGAL